MYNHKNRYRCTIIRGKAQSDIEDLIPIYADILLSCEGFDEEIFKKIFDSNLSKFLVSPTQKTLDNHRTEIANKLFGMYLIKEGRLIVSERTKKVIEDDDLPSFFKSIITYFQFPNGMDAIYKIQQRIDSEIRLRPFHFILKLLSISKAEDIVLSKRELAYYVLDSLDALQGIAQAEEVLEQIKIDRKQRIIRKVEYYDEDGTKKDSSFSMQHLSEQLNILELANLITQKSRGHEKSVFLNSMEESFIQFMIKEDANDLLFDPYSYNDLNQLRADWQDFYCSNPLKLSMPETASKLLLREEVTYASSDSPLDVGDEGEAFVFNNEKNRVSAFNNRLARKVLLLGKQRGLGYDIQSVWADLASDFSKQADAVFYIEVKSTKRVTPPNLNGSDKLVLTRSEYLAADQHKENFAIYRVYLTSKGVFVYKIFNPLSVDSECEPLCTPIKYNYEFTMVGEVEQWQ